MREANLRSLTPSLPAEVACQTFLTSMFFANCPQNFCTYTGHLWKVAKSQKFKLPSSETCVSAKVCLALVADQTLACQFACTLSLCNLQCFKYSWKFWIWHSFQLHYPLWFMMHTKTTPTMVSMELRFRELYFFQFVAYQHFNFAKFQVQTSNKLKT